MRGLQYKIISFNADDPDGEREVNDFLASAKVLTETRNVSALASEIRVTFVFGYVEGSKGAKRSGRSRRGSVDFESALTEAEKAIYDRLKGRRNMIAAKEGFKNYEGGRNVSLQIMLLARCSTMEDLDKVQFFDSTKYAKYAPEYLEILGVLVASRKGVGAYSRGSFAYRYWEEPPEALERNQIAV